MLSKTCYYDVQNIVYAFSKPFILFPNYFFSILGYYLYLQCDTNAKLNVIWTFHFVLFCWDNGELADLEFAM